MVDIESVRVSFSRACWLGYDGTQASVIHRRNTSLEEINRNHNHRIARQNNENAIKAAAKPPR
jgi:hypothetical protein